MNPNEDVDSMATATRPGLDRQLAEVEARVLEIGAATRQMLVDAGITVQTMDAVRARAVVTADDAVDESYLGIERAVLDLMARQQPVAGDLRRLVAILQIGLHLERMADTAVEVSRQVLRSGDTASPPDLVRDLAAMGAQVRRMLDEALRAACERRRDLCLAVVRLEGELDEAHEALFTGLAAAAGEGLPLPSVLWVDRVARLFQRAGQHAVDVAEAAWFQITGELREFDRDDGVLVEEPRERP